MSELAGWRLYYHGAPMKGRGEYLRIIFEAARVPFTEIGDFPSLQERCDAFNPSMKSMQSQPSFAPPIVIDPEGNSFSQVSAIAAYLGKRFGLFPDTVEGEFKALQIQLSISDFHSEGRACFHPVDNVASYFTQVEEAKIAVEKFCSGRLVKWLNHFDHLLESNNGGANYFVGDKMTYVDLTACHLFNAVAQQFPEAWEAIDVPLVKAFRTRINDFEPVREYYASGRAKPWEGNSMN